MSTEEQPLFSTLSIRTELQQSLAAANYVEMTPVQALSAPAILDKRDILAQAETGSGKTAAFAIGILNALDVTQFETQALVICPTRELSEQVAVEIRKLASGLANTRVLTLCGGKPMQDQLTSLKREPHVVVGTPGRLLKHLEKGTLNTSTIQSLVLDEADRMLDMGFYDDIRKILSHSSPYRQTMLFSATYPSEIISISREIQTDPIKVKVEPTETSENIEQVFVIASDKQKPEALMQALGKYQPENAIIFCNRKVHVQALCEKLQQQGFHAGALHGDLEQRERDEAIILFANKSISFLVATDVAARGLDINALSAVINYDIAQDAETHVHRIGRTGRAGMQGRAITFVDPDELYRVRAIEQLQKAEHQFVELHAHDRNDAYASTPLTTTIHINSGKKDKIRPGDIVGALTVGSELSNDDIGKITVQAKQSFVAIDYGKSDVALKILSEGRIKKQKVRARRLKGK